MEATNQKSGDMAWVWWAIGGIVLGLISFGVWVWFKLNQIQDAIEKISWRRGNGEPPEDVVIDVATTTEKEAPKETALVAPVVSEPPFFHSNDFRTVKLNGQALPILTPDQALALKNGVDLVENGVEEFDQRDLLKGVGTAARKRLRDTFRSNPTAYRVLFAPVEKRKGIFRFNF